MNETKKTDPRVERTRRRVVDAALKLMRGGGPGAITYSTLAEASGVGRATIYRHWPNLDALWPELLQEVQAQMSVAFTGDLRNDLRVAVEILASNVRAEEDRVRLVTMLERAQWDAETMRMVRIAEQHSPVMQVIGSAVEAGMLPDSSDPQQEVSLLVGPLLHRVLFDSGEIDEAFIEHVLDRYLASIGG